MTQPEAVHPPSWVYFHGCIGTWRAPYALQIRDATALRHAGLSWLDTLGLRLLGAWPFGGLWLHTSVRVDGAFRVIHTTDLRFWRIPLMQSVETITLDEDGRRFGLEGTQRIGPFGLSTRPVSGTGEVDDTAHHATYLLTWLGLPLHQHTTRDGNTVRLHQTCEAFVATPTLVRQAP